MVNPVSDVVYCPDISSYVQVSSFIEINTHNNGLIVAQLKSIKLLHDGSTRLKFCKYPFCNATNTKQQMGGYYVNHSMTTYPGKLLRKVFCSNEFMEECSPLDVKSICFIFTPLQLELPQYRWCAGMSHVYCVRHVAMSVLRYNSGSRHPVPEHHLPFPSSLGIVTKYLHERVWGGLFILYQEFQQLLNSHSKKQGLFTKRSKTFPFFCPEAVCYILKSCSDCVPRREFVVCRSYMLTETGMRRRRIKGPSIGATMLRFKSKEQLSKLCTKILGITGRLGVCAQQPKLSKKDGVSILENTAINFVQENNVLECSPDIKMNCLRDGVDIIFMKDGFVKIVVCYQMYLLQFNSNGYPVRCSSSSLMDILTSFPRDEIIIDKSNNEQESDDEKDGGNNNDGDDVISVTSAESKETASLSDISATAGTTSVANSMASFFEVGTCFCTGEHPTVWRMLSVQPKYVVAEVVNPGRDTTLQPGSYRKFTKKRPVMHQGLLSYNS